MKQQNINLLLIKHNLYEAEQCKNLLLSVNPFFNIHYANSIRQLHHILPYYDRFDIILTDLELFDSSGIDTLNRIYDCFPQIPIIGIIANDQAHTYKDVLAACDSNMYVQKPNSSINDLFYNITEIVNQYYDGMSK